MIIITEKAGRLGNKLTLYSHFISYHAMHGIKLMNVALDDDAELFENTARDLFCRYPAKKSFIKPTSYLRNRLYRATLKLANIIERLNFAKSLVRVIRLNTNEAISLDDPSYIKILNKTPLVFIKGYKFRYQSEYVKSASIIKEYFKPKDYFMVSSENRLNILKAKSDITVGVHIRQGDYKMFMDGLWYFSASQYVDVMRRLTELLKPSTVGFLVCSNVKQKQSDFINLIVEFGSESAVEDMYTLSKCDYLVGPPSSFNSWAAFYGDVPIYYLSRAAVPESLDEFKKFEIPNC